MNNTQTTWSAKIIQLIGFLYKTLCLAFLVLWVTKLIFNDGSWINYFIIFLCAVTALVIWEMAKSKIFSAK